MDFVVVGVGLGAFAVLVGLLLRERGGPWRRAANGHHARTIRRGGGLLAAAGGMLLLATVLALVLGLDDRAGAIVVLAVVALAVAVGIAWAARAMPRRAPVRVALTSAAMARASADDADDVPEPLLVGSDDLPEEATLATDDGPAEDATEGGPLVAVRSNAAATEPGANGSQDVVAPASFDEGDGPFRPNPLAAEDAATADLPDTALAAALPVDDPPFDDAEPESSPVVDHAALDAVRPAGEDDTSTPAASSTGIAAEQPIRDLDPGVADRDAQSDDHPAASLDDPETGEHDPSAAGDDALDAAAPRLRIVPAAPDRTR